MEINQCDSCHGEYGIAFISLSNWYFEVEFLLQFGTDVSVEDDFLSAGVHLF